MQHFFQAFQDWWHQQTWVSIVAVVTGLACVILAAKNSIWNWPVAIISTTLTIYVMAVTGFYADVLQNAYLTIINIYGWITWTKNQGAEDKRPVVRISKQQIYWSFAAIIFISPALGFFLIRFSAALNYQPPAFPYIDSFCTVVSLTAQVLMARKVLENWLIWVFVDMIYIVIYSAKSLEIFAALFVAYFLVAAWGYFDWRSVYRKQTPDIS